MSKLYSISPNHLLSLLLLFSISFLSSVNSLIHNSDQERTILLKLKNELGNPPLIDSWISSSLPHCNWTGIICNELGSVTNIQLSNINITSEIPHFICDLKNLIEIDFSSNYIFQRFPTFLYNCSKLQILNLYLNMFIGPIPDDIYRISTLKTLNLGVNNFSGYIPASISRLSNLESLELGTNQFLPSKFPPELGQLKNLTYLQMQKANLIGEIPEMIGNLSNLEILSLAENNFSGKIPRSLFLSKNLKELYLWGNKLSAEIPNKIECLNLNHIDLSMNKLTGPIPEGFGKLRNLSVLDMHTNSLTGEIPASIGRIPSLTDSRLFRNKFTGILPPELGFHSKLIYFEAWDNKLTGNLPENLCAGGVLLGIAFYSNYLTGGLPRSFQNCNSLVDVVLHNNEFSGEILSGFWSLTNLTTVNIGYNLFSGEFPDKLSSNLKRIEMNNNRFTGKIPTQISESPNLEVFTGINNEFSGKIPVELTFLSKLLTLSLDGNQLSGRLPSKIISWSSLKNLTLSRNHLSGELPLDFAKLTNLTELDLSENQFSGEIPSEFGRLNKIFLNFSSNNFIGKIPTPLEGQGYITSFLNNSGLCGSNQIFHNRSCLSQLRNSSKLSSRLLIMIIVLSVAIFIIAILLVLLAVRCFRKRKGGEEAPATWKLTTFHRLSFTETDILSNLSEDNLIGRGGSGTVYKVPINSSGSYVAVKKINGKGKLVQKMEKEFQSEVQTLGTVRHSNIVKLLCCISSKNSKLLIYDFMENGSLYELLHGRKKRPSNLNGQLFLDWPKRMEIAIGTAQGLSYLHHNCSPSIIHRDVKSSNILLDSEFKAKVADFGIAKLLTKPGEPNSTSVVAGTFGYIAPEYGQTKKVDEKIDVYSFGVVLLELATGKEPNRGDEHTNLAEWAWQQFQEVSTLDVLLDEEVKEDRHLEEMRMVFKLGVICTNTLPSPRPSMRETLQILQKHGPLQKHASISDYVVPLLTSDSNNHLPTYTGRESRSLDLVNKDNKDDHEGIKGDNFV